MTSTRKLFEQNDADSYLGILQKIASDPPSSNILDPTLVNKIQVYLDSAELKTPVSVWNHYKYILDLTVRGGLGSSFIVRLLDLEAFLQAPEGSSSQEAGNMSSAPWRGF